MTELEISYRRSTSFPDFTSPAEPKDSLSHAPVVEMAAASGHKTNLIDTTAVPDSSNPFWIEEEEAEEAFKQQAGTPNANGFPTNGSTSHAPPHNPPTDDGIPVPPGGRSLPAPSQALTNMQLLSPDPQSDSARDAEGQSMEPQGVVWGPLTFEARRFVELRKLTFYGTAVQCMDVLLRQP